MPTRRAEARASPHATDRPAFLTGYTLAGVEAMAMLAKGQVRAVPVNDMPAQRAFVHQLFGLAA
jgi:hypothetical protein